ncbi:MAG: sulfotransferase [Proteobacteria bacterium]|nr:sulfotransferase [Pseudomonadota bacterium]MBU1060663.1 sulfotransferase [Pseudomonadota bacterium]
MNKKIIVVIGPGRSGTSLIMQFLASCNISTTTRQIESNNSNPKGFWEDREIVNLEREFLEKKKPAHLPIPVEDFEREDALCLKSRIKEILLKSLDNSAGLFAIKDPKITLLFPIWKKIFYECGLEPVYIFACRNPGAFIDSNIKILEDKVAQEVLEWAWYYRTVSSFYFTDSELFVVHYEDWFVDPQKQAALLLDYIGVDCQLGELDIFNTVDKSLNRSTTNNIVLINSCVRKSYSFISRLKGSNFVSHEVQKEMGGWWNDIWDHINWLYPEFRWRNRRINELEKSIELLRMELIKTKEPVPGEKKAGFFWKGRRIYQKVKKIFI